MINFLYIDVMNKKELRKEIISFLSTYVNDTITLERGYNIILYTTESLNFNSSNIAVRELISITVLDDAIKIDSSYFDIYTRVRINELDYLKRIISSNLDNILDRALTKFNSRKGYDLTCFPVIDYEKYSDFMYNFILNYKEIDKFKRFDNIVETFVEEIYNNKNYIKVKPFLEEKLNHLICANNFDLL